MELLKSTLNSVDHLTQPKNTSSSWSELPLDLLNSVFERLSFANFQRGKSVCSSWYSASRQSVPTNHIPWLLLFPKDEDNDNVCKLFNPEEKEKPYKTRDLGLEFSKSVCVATCGSWLLMRDPRFNLYIVNLFTNDEIIKLPPFEAQLGPTKVEGSLETEFRFSNARKKRKEEFNANQIHIDSPVFWIDDKTKDYIVLWGLVRWCVVYARNGDTSWNQIRNTSCCFDMVYKHHKLYFSSFARKIFIIIDFSRGIPKQTFLCRLRIAPFDPSSKYVVLPYVRTKLVVTLSGDVLRVERIICRRSGNSTFLVYRVYSSRTYKKYERVDSLGDEAMLLNMGITVLANDIEGFKRNSIYFNGSNGKNITCIFNLETQKMEPQHEIDCSSVWQLNSARWFLPSFNRKCY